jgi:hypothetical protein
MTKYEAQRLNHQEKALLSLGFTREEANKLRRISMTLHRWYELECGDGNGCVERDEETGKCYWLNSVTMRRYPVADRETGAIKRLNAIIKMRNERALTQLLNTGNEISVTKYIQTDPRGAALYIIRPGDIPEGETVQSCYSRGIVVY